MRNSINSLNCRQVKGTYSSAKSKKDYSTVVQEPIKPLKSNFIGKGEVKGFKMGLLGMTDRALIYEVDTGDSIYYEVFKKTVNHRFACISYPTSKSFGIWAWTYSDLGAAIKKYNQLNFQISWIN